MMLKSLPKIISLSDIDEMSYDYIRESYELYGNTYKEYCIGLLNNMKIDEYGEVVPLQEGFLDSSVNSVGKFFKGLLRITQVMIRNIITSLSKGTLKPHQFMKMHLAAVKHAMSENYMTNWDFDAYKFEGLDKIKPDTINTINDNINKNTAYSGYYTAMNNFVTNKDQKKLLEYLDSSAYAAFYKDAQVMNKIICKAVLNTIGVTDVSKIDEEDNEDLLHDFSEILYNQLRGEEEVTLKIGDIRPDEMVEKSDSEKLTGQYKASCAKLEANINTFLEKLEALKREKTLEDNSGKKDEIKKNQRRIVAALMFYAKCEQAKLTLLQATNNAFIKVNIQKAAQDAAIFKSILEYEPSEAAKDKDKTTTTTTTTPTPTTDNSNNSSGDSSGGSGDGNNGNGNGNGAGGAS